MARRKLSPNETRIPAPMRMLPAYWRKLKGIAAAFSISPGAWVESQIEPHMSAKDKEG